MRVVLVVLDGLPARHVGPAVTPELGRLARGRPGTGRAVMTSATYPNHATFATGVGPEDHGLWANWVNTSDGPQPAWRVGPAVPTLFHACRAAGRGVGAVVGDHHLVGVMGLADADEHWPPGGTLPDDVERDAHGYATDAEVARRARPCLAAGFDLVLVHLNEPDTAGHVFGPDSDAAMASFRATDEVFASLVDELRPVWDDTVLLVVSDHDQETLLDEPPVDLWAAVERAGVGVVPIPEGTASVAWGEDHSAGAWLDGIAGVAGHREVEPGVRLVWAEPGRQFALPPGFDPSTDRGQHGGVTTRDQVAVVAGGHPAVARIDARAPGAADWAPTIATLLDVDLRGARGRALVG